MPGPCMLAWCLSRLQHGVEARQRALLAALDDLKAYLASDKGRSCLCETWARKGVSDCTRWSLHAQVTGHPATPPPGTFGNRVLPCLPTGQVAIFDATNTTHERRQFLVGISRVGG